LPRFPAGCAAAVRPGGLAWAEAEQHLLHWRGLNCLMLHFHPMIEGISCFAAEIMPRVAAAKVRRDRMIAEA
jgi:hypothetical protein